MATITGTDANSLKRLSTNKDSIFDNQLSEDLISAIALSGIAASTEQSTTSAGADRMIDRVLPVAYDRSLALSPLFKSHTSEVSSSDKIEELMKSLPLLAKEDPICLAEDLFLEAPKDSSLYFGTGLCTTKEMSAGLPFDILGLIATAEKTRKTLGFGKVIQLIADTHAKSNKFESDEQVNARAQEFKKQILTAIERLGLSKSYQVILASEFDTSKEYTDIYKGINPDIAHEYVRREWSDMEYLARTQNTRLKLSWKMPVKPGKAHKSDEAFFDKGFVTHFQRPYSFISNKASITFDPARLNVCPYTSASGEKRILIQQDEDAEAKLKEFNKSSNKAVGKASEALATTVDFVDRTFGLQVPDGTLGEKINAITQRLFY